MHLSTFSSLCLGATVVLGSPIVQKRDIDLNEARCPDFCKNTYYNTNSADKSGNYVCDDLRLGPKTLPSAIPLQGIVGPDSTYRRFGGRCPGQYLTEFWGTDDKNKTGWRYPIVLGYGIDTAGKPATFNFTLLPGVYIDRFGGEGGDYTSPAGTPYAMRSLPPWNLNTRSPNDPPYGYHVYRVAAPIVVQAGPISPHFGQPGLGLQFFMPANVSVLADQGNLTRVNLTATPNWWDFS
ncbi:hypothetical protein CGCF415_v000840 [Colletotrichum fructicola]|uniref:TNT domain-containing protein n=2 Tax=Colletotrichum gloeosporioides species complex TaxID=2707338 RepID=A0A7J6JH52_COLFN|nr:uncharacterized protein CGMCC3_g5814 [Colletotrichum fructicola]KAF4489647.1 hypothetical protein CGGC5_v004160 [Colletotrichum fructicola Nara gc5]KAK1838848.1 hypothetical protein CCHR01_18532 [Colletotrichum chrysophilum]KAE9578034.1 hypothetical protein CGMCC3_g5814 [Colletotrichum fructicola]KAF4896327.1 hypothetical protein CGCFRS4_v005453 [Colletotrichum fructicola]KAF4916014.1 hypothetical protein CGCF415_v000840 [Colletotrichum fructicola]